MHTGTLAGFGLALVAIFAVAPLAAQPSEAFDQYFTPFVFQGDLDNFGSELAVGDYNGDGRADVAGFGYNHEAGLAAGGLWIGRGNVPFNVCCGDYVEGVDEERLGQGVAFGDFDGDGADEVVAGRPGRTIGTAADAGDVGIFKLAPGGGGIWNELESWSQDSADIGGGAEVDDEFGRALVVGDFNNDDIDDLAIGVPGEAVGSILSAGAVNVLYGVATIGLTATGNQLFHEDTAGIPGAAETGDRFGIELAAGDVTCDGIDDLVVGVPNEDSGAAENTGAVLVLPGSAAGLTATGSFTLGQSDFGVAVQAGARFGSEIVVAGLNDGSPACRTLVISAPQRDAGAEAAAGTVFLYTGGASAVWTQADIGATDEASDLFGSGLAAGDFDGDGWAELAIGAPGEDVLLSDHVGMVFIVSPEGSLASPPPALQWWVRRGMVAFDGFQDVVYFGAALAAADFNGDGLDDLAVGAPLTGSDSEGAVAVFFSALFAEDFEGNDFGGWSATSP